MIQPVTSHCETVKLLFVYLRIITTFTTGLPLCKTTWCIEQLHIVSQKKILRKLFSCNRVLTAFIQYRSRLFSVWFCFQPCYQAEKTHISHKSQFWKIILRRNISYNKNALRKPLAASFMPWSLLIFTYKTRAYFNKMHSSFTAQCLEITQKPPRNVISGRLCPVNYRFYLVYYFILLRNLTYPNHNYFHFHLNINPAPSMGEWLTWLQVHSSWRVEARQKIRKTKSQSLFHVKLKTSGKIVFVIFGTPWTVLRDSRASTSISEEKEY